MSLSKKIVIVNEFTNTVDSSRGSTPGDYVSDYVARDDAVDTLFPLQSRKNSPSFSENMYITRYMARHDATEVAIANYDTAKQLHHEITELEAGDGRAFGNHGLSYTEKQTLEEADKMQKCFDEGHTVLKTVISFETDYLIEQGILPKNFTLVRKGDFKGKVDQLKLRHALSDGMNALTKNSGFDDPIWVGAIQVDTKHVHAHFALSENGQNDRIRYDGQERGMFTPTEMSVLRTGIHRSLRNSKNLHSLHSQVDSDRRNAVNHTQQLIFDHVKSNVLLQQIIASLPKSKKLWRYGSNSKIMKRPNELMKSYITSLQNNYDNVTHFSNTKESIESYADEKADKDFLSPVEREQVVQNGLQLLEERIANNIYGQLSKNLRPSKTHVSTPFMTSQAYDSSDLKMLIQQDTQINPLNLFAYRSQVYSDRLANHIEEVLYYQDALIDYEEADKQGMVSDDAVIMKRFYESEQKYHMSAVDKYRTFIGLDDRFDSSFHVSDSFRPYVESEGQKLKEILKVYQNQDMDVIPKLSRMIQEDEDIQSKFEVIVDRKRKTTVYDYLTVLEREPLTPLPTSVMTYLNRLGTTHPKYNNVAKVITDTQLSIISDSFTGHSLPPSVLKQIDDYSDKRNDLLMREWGMGYVNASDVSFKDDIATSIIEQKTVQPLPNKLPKDHLVGNESDYAKSVQAVDLHDILNDFPPKTSRKVGRSRSEKYEKTVQDRLEAVDEAVDYLERTNQIQEDIVALQHQLRLHKQLAKIIRDNDELPVLDQPVEEISHERQFKTISLDTSDIMTKTYINNVALIHEEFENDVRSGGIESAVGIEQVEEKEVEEKVEENLYEA